MEHYLKHYLFSAYLSQKNKKCTFCIFLYIYEV